MNWLNHIDSDGPPPDWQDASWGEHRSLGRHDRGWGQLPPLEKCHPLVEPRHTQAIERKKQ